MINFTHLAAITPLRSELLSSAALTPTQHKGGGGGNFKKLLGLAAGFLLPIATPAISGAIGLSGVIGAKYANALVGGVLGAGAGYVAGGKTGGVLGGVGGASLGYFNTPGVRSQAQARSVASNAVPTNGNVSAPSPRAAQISSANLGPNISNAEGTEVLFGGQGVNNLSKQGFIPGPDTQMFGPTKAFTGLDYAGGGFTQRVPLTSGDPTFGDRFQAGLSGIYDKAKEKLADPEFWVDNALKLGNNYLTDKTVGNAVPQTDQQIASRNAQNAALEQMNKQNQANIAFRTEKAKQLNRDADAYNPFIKAGDAYGANMIQSKRGQEKGRRAIDPRNTGLRLANDRRNQLESRRSANTAYTRAFEQAENTQRGLRTAALNSMPKGDATYANAKAAQYAADTLQAPNLQTERDRASKYYGTTLNEVFGRDSEEEKKKRLTDANNQPVLS